MKEQKITTIELFTDIALSIYTAVLVSVIVDYMRTADPFYIDKLDRKLNASAFKLDWRWMLK